ncbi:MAG: YciI family protein [Egibacteraceae bacterium]
MQYLLMIYTDESNTYAPDSPEAKQEFEDYGQFTEELHGSGKFLAGEALLPTETATTVRVRDGETLTTDGPFAETKEQLGGFYMVEVDDLDAAIEIAARIPGAKHGSIEVRPIMVWDQ